MLHKEKLKVSKLGQIEGFGGGAYIYICVFWGKGVYMYVLCIIIIIIQLLLLYKDKLKVLG